MMAAAITFDVIWFARNKIAHGGDHIGPQQMIAKVRRRYLEHNMAWEEKLGKNANKWKPPTTIELKINYDVAVFNGAFYFVAI